MYYQCNLAETNWKSACRGASDIYYKAVRKYGGDGTDSRLPADHSDAKQYDEALATIVVVQQLCELPWCHIPLSLRVSRGYNAEKAWRLAARIEG